MLFSYNACIIKSWSYRCTEKARNINNKSSWEVTSKRSGQQDKGWGGIGCESEYAVLFSFFFQTEVPDYNQTVRLQLLSNLWIWKTHVTCGSINSPGHKCSIQHCQLGWCLTVLVWWGTTSTEQNYSMSLSSVGMVCPKLQCNMWKYFKGENEHMQETQNAASSCRNLQWKHCKCYRLCKWTNNVLVQGAKMQWSLKNSCESKDETHTHSEMLCARYGTLYAFLIHRCLTTAEKSQKRSQEVVS